MATLSRIVLGSELARVLSDVEGSGEEFKLRVFQLDQHDKFRIVIHLEGIEGAGWQLVGMKDPPPGSE